MIIKISEPAAKWYKEELDLNPPVFIRLFPRYGGVGGRIPGFSIGINFKDPHTIFASVEKDGITFYVEETDSWYFDSVKQLDIDLDDKTNEPIFSYSEDI